MGASEDVFESLLSSIEWHQVTATFHRHQLYSNLFPKAIGKNVSRLQFC